MTIRNSVRSLKKSGLCFSKRLNMEVMGELFLLMIVATLFLTMFFQSFDWPLGAALMPRIVVSIGMVIWILRVMALVRRSEERPEQIMDVGFGEISGEATVRLIRISGFIAVLIIGIWLLGWHVSLPLWMFVYLWLYGEVKWWWAATTGCVALGFIVAFDVLTKVPWNQPLLIQLLSW